MKAIVFGATGQDGSHLIDLLLSKDYDVVGVTRRSSTDNTKRLKNRLGNKKLKLIEGDITDVSSVINIFKDNDDVDEIYNLAAQSHVGTSFKQPALTWDVTGKGCINILQAMVDLNMFHARFYQASSSEMFGSSYDIDKDGNKYQDENTKFMPNSPYAIAKCAAHYAVRMYRDAYNLHASCGILFNHEGPKRGDNFVTKKITNWIRDFALWRNKYHIEPDQLNPSGDYIYGPVPGMSFPRLRLGNIDTFRDWGYAGDYVEAMWMMLQKEHPDDYVVCTETTHTVAEFLDIAFNAIGLPAWRDYIVIDPEFYRPSEVPFLKGSYKKAREKLGWSPKHSLEDLIKLMLLSDEKL
jgi:GDPmannose 4,6-dehydratase